MKVAIVALCLALFAVALAEDIVSGCQKGCSRQCDVWKFENQEILKFLGPIVDIDSLDKLCHGAFCSLVCSLEGNLAENTQ